jgi:hypothetical protein
MINPSGVIAERLNGQMIAGYQVQGVVIDGPLQKRAKYIQTLLETTKPAAYLSLGVHAQQDKFVFIKSVVNKIHTVGFPDHIDGQMTDIPVVPGAQQVLTNNTIDFERFRQRFEAEGYSTTIREDALGAGALTAAFAQLYYGSPDMPRLAMSIPPDVTFTEWEKRHNRVVAEPVDLDIIEGAARLALELLAETIKSHEH